MIYVLEGPNCVGKTTIAKKLAERLKVPYYRDIGRTNLEKFFDINDDEFDPEDWYISGIQNCLDIAQMSKMFDFVVDRWLLTNIVHDFIRELEWKNVNVKRIIDQSDVRLILLNASYETYLSRYYKRKREDVENINNLTYLYNLAATNCSCLGLCIESIDNNDLDPNDIVEEIFKRFN